MLAFWRNIWMGADTTFVLKQFRKRRGNSVLLPEPDARRCADKLRGQCRLNEKLRKLKFQAAQCRGFFQSLIYLYL